MTKELSPVERVKSLTESPAIKNRIAEVMGKKSAGFVSSLVSAVSANKELQNCDPMSIVSSAMIAAVLDLPINPTLGMAHIVPYKGVAAFQIGWKGIVQLALRSGQYKTLNATVIYEGQIKKHNQFTGEIEFNDDRTSDKVVGYLLFFRLLNGFEKYHYWTKEQCEAHAKRYSQTYRAGVGPWKKMFDEMALKTVVKLGLLKYGILSIHMQEAIEKDEYYEGAYLDSTATEEKDPGPPAPVGKKTSRLHDAIGATDTTAKPAPEKESAPELEPDDRGHAEPPAFVGESELPI